MFVLQIFKSSFCVYLFGLETLALPGQGFFLAYAKGFAPLEASWPEIKKPLAVANYSQRLKFLLIAG
jgi:hypothetical protein